MRLSQLGTGSWMQTYCGPHICEGCIFNPESRCRSLLMAAFLTPPAPSVSRKVFLGQKTRLVLHPCTERTHTAIVAHGRIRLWRVQGQRWARSARPLATSMQTNGVFNKSSYSSSSGKLRRFALISDVHIFDQEEIWQENALSFIGQRFLGLMNILLLRGPDKYSRYVLETAIADMKDEGVQHVICAGDITNLAIESEFRAARRVFETFGGSRSMTFIPGNHDTYNRAQARCCLFHKHFGKYAVSDIKAVSPRGDGFPILQERGGVIFVCLNSGRPNTARGFVGRRQWDAARAMLNSAEGQCALDDARFKVLVVHHPTQNPRIRGLPWIRDLGHDLKDWRDVAVFCEEYGIQLCVHGHNHVPYTGRMFGSEGTLIYEAGSGTMLVEDPERVARYNVFELDESGNLERTYARVWDSKLRGFRTQELPIPEAGPPVPVRQRALVRDVAK